MQYAHLGCSSFSHIAAGGLSQLTEQDNPVPEPSCSSRKDLKEPSGKSPDDQAIGKHSWRCRRSAVWYQVVKRQFLKLIAIADEAPLHEGETYTRRVPEVPLPT